MRTETDDPRALVGAHVIDCTGKLADVREVILREDQPRLWVARLTRFNGEPAGWHLVSSLRVLERSA